MPQTGTTTVKRGAAWWSPLVLALLVGLGPAAPGGETSEPDTEAGAAQKTATAAAAAGFQVRPVLRFPGSTTMVLTWVMAAPADCVLRYGEDPQLDRQLTVGSPQMFEFADPAKTPPAPPAPPGTPPAAPPAGAPAAAPAVPLEKNYIFTAKIENLKPGTAYRYEVSAANARAGGVFRTFPDRPEPFTFLAFSDVHFRDAVSGWFAAQKPALLINSGDLVDREHYLEYVKFLSEGMGTAAGRWPMFVARGNHDGSAKWLARFFSAPEGQHYYSFDYGDAHFVCLDTLLGRGDKSGKYQAMLEWCEKDLAESKARWKIVFRHFPSYDVGKHLSGWGRKDFLPIFRKHGVDLTLAGHDHSYQRFKPMFTTGENEARPITHIVAAGGGGGLFRMEVEPQLVLSDVSEHSFLAVSVSRDRLVGRCIGADGRELDSFTIDKKADGSYDPAWLAQAVPEDKFGELRDAVRPSLKGSGLPEDPRSGKTMTVKLQLGAPDRAIKFEIRPEKRTATEFEVTPATGEASAGGVTEVEVKVRLRKPELYKELKDVPWLRLECHIESGGQKASIVRYLVYSPEEKDKKPGN